MQARIYSPTPTNLNRLAAVLRRGGLVAIPTETVYGLAANALEAKACQAIFRAKGRPANDPLIVHVLDLAHAEDLAHFNVTARRVARKFWPGPLTIVLRKKPSIPDIVTSGGPTVALRAPAHVLARKLLRFTNLPLAAPSANPFNYISPTTAAHVKAGLGDRISHILDGGASRIGVESTVLDLTNPRRPVILRPGAIGPEQLSVLLGRKIVIKANSGGIGSPKPAPGMLKKHYSPRIPLHRVADPGKASSQIAVIHLRRADAAFSSPHDYWLSRSGSLPEMARNLYRVLRLIDNRGYQEIRMELLPPGGVGLAPALIDRMCRAAGG